MGIKKVFNKAIEVAKEHGPEAMVIGGCILGVGAAVMAIKNTKETTEEIDKIKEERDEINEVIDEKEEKGEDVTEEKKARVETYRKIAVEYARAYGLPAIMGLTSIGMIIGGHFIVKKRYVATAGSLAALSQQFVDYRARVADRLGEEEEQRLAHNIRKTKVTRDVEDAETGKVKKVKDNLPVINPNDLSDFAVLFDEDDPGFEWGPENRDVNLFRVAAVQNAYNDQLKTSDGNLIFMNEIFRSIGINKKKLKKLGQINGWRYSADKFLDKESYIDLRARPVYVEYDVDPDFEADRYHWCILIDPNVDGPVADFLGC